MKIDKYDKDYVIHISDFSNALYSKLEKDLADSGVDFSGLNLVLQPNGDSAIHLFFVYPENHHNEMMYSIPYPGPLKRQWINMCSRHPSLGTSPLNFDTLKLKKLFDYLLEQPEAKWYKSGLANRVSLKDWEEKGEKWATEKFRGVIAGKKFGF